MPFLFQALDDQISIANVVNFSSSIGSLITSGRFVRDTPCDLGLAFLVGNGIAWHCNLEALLSKRVVAILVCKIMLRVCSR